MTTIAELIDTPTVTTALSATDRDGAIRELAALLAADGRVTDLDGYVAAVLVREEETGGTGMESGVAIPHAKHAGVTRASVAFGRSANRLDFGAADGTGADLVFLIAAPEGADDIHVRVLSRLARRLIHESFRTSLREAGSDRTVVDIIHREVEL